MKKHLPLVLLRLVIAYGLVRVMAFTHVRWGQQYPGDGQDAFGFVLVFLGIGVAAAALYFVLASLLHFFRRQRSWLGIFGVDAFLGACFAGLLAFAGVTSSYSVTPGGGSASGTAPSGRP